IQTRVRCGCDAARTVLGQQHWHEPGIVGTEGFDLCGGGVARAVVNDEDLDVGQRLGSDAVQALVDVLLDVVGGDDDADGGQRGCSFRPSGQGAADDLVGQGRVTAQPDPSEVGQVHAE